ncbi:MULTISPECIES: hypothetical protein [Bacillaceae]|uniref:Sporulation lipoprotein YhcN/YlaJ (Spore_YhcN_YlaJ) n=1 Tax=Evansella alkalicola TaxID=745819 RepID=A0ABS6K0N9_9BACI|nr:MULTISPECIES: hypothetical protein [Bacillaceae]MBU9724012.1 hypothetical protein [Bacillus alkalicola]
MVRIIILFLIPLLLISCQNPPNGQTAFEAEGSRKPSISQDTAQKMRAEVQAMSEVDHVTSVSLEDDVYMTLTVTGFQRLFLEKIRKTAFDRAKKVDKNTTVHISTDRKVDMELKELEKKVYRNEITKKDLEKELMKVEDDMKG